LHCCTDAAETFGAPVVGVEVEPVEAPVEAVLPEVLFELLLELPQPASSAAQASTASGAGESLRVIELLLDLKDRAGACGPARSI
jgi:hypothetical protein